MIILALLYAFLAGASFVTAGVERAEGSITWRWHLAYTILYTTAATGIGCYVAVTA